MTVTAADLGVTVTDNCDPDVSVTHNDVVVPSSYDINWYAADPVAGSAPYLPTYLKFSPGSLAGPTTGRAADPLRNAVAYGPTAGQLDAAGCGATERGSAATGANRAESAGTKLVARSNT